MSPRLSDEMTRTAALVPTLIAMMPLADAPDPRLLAAPSPIIVIATDFNGIRGDFAVAMIGTNATSGNFFRESCKARQISASH